MTINRRTKKVQVKTYTSAVDIYGQPRISTATSRYVDMSIVSYTQRQNSNPTYLDCEAVGLTKDTQITTSDCIIDDGTTYDVVYVIKSERFNQVLLRKKK